MITSKSGSLQMKLQENYTVTLKEKQNHSVALSGIDHLLWEEGRGLAHHSNGVKKTSYKLLKYWLLFPR